jgi:hypothetical protein
MPAKAGIQGNQRRHRACDSWIPDFAGMTGRNFPPGRSPSYAARGRFARVRRRSIWVVNRNRPITTNEKAVVKVPSA